MVKKISKNSPKDGSSPRAEYFFEENKPLTQSRPFRTDGLMNNDEMEDVEDVNSGPEDEEGYFNTYEDQPQQPPPSRRYDDTLQRHDHHGPWSTFLPNQQISSSSSSGKKRKAVSDEDGDFHPDGEEPESISGDKSDDETWIDADENKQQKKKKKLPPRSSPAKKPTRKSPQSEEQTRRQSKDATSASRAPRNIDTTVIDLVD
jgi:hypothetical protein